MNFLFKQRPNIKALDLTYDSKDFFQKKEEGGSHHQMEYTRQAQAKAKLISKVKEIFMLHGASEYEVPIVTPYQSTATLFLSLEQQLLARENRLSSEDKALDSKLELAVKLDIDYGKDEITGRKMEVVESVGDKKQKVVYHNIEEVCWDSGHTQKYIDQTGAVLQLQGNLLHGFARAITKSKMEFFKRYAVE